jgi:hypothetical protein
MNGILSLTQGPRHRQRPANEGGRDISVPSQLCDFCATEHLVI